MTLANGFKVMGYSAPVSDENFNETIGEAVALSKVRDQLWELLGFRLKQAIYEGPKFAPAGDYDTTDETEIGSAR